MEPQVAPYLRYWGKTGPTVPPYAQTWHPVAYHLLDVAAVAEAIMERDPALRRRLALLLGLPEALAAQWLIVLAALHDVGKLSAGFQALRPDIAAAQLGALRTCDRARHDALGSALLGRMPTLRRLQERAFPALPGRPGRVGLRRLLAAATGHHGRPCHLDPARINDFFTPDDLAAADACLADVLDAVAPGPPAQVAGQPDRIPRATWLVAGLLVLADWIGSNQGWFPPAVTGIEARPALSLAEYWIGRARPCASAAVASAGLLPAPPAAGLTLGGLLPESAEPTPLQREVAATPLGSGPQLFVIEDVTGSGKTEAALFLAWRLMAAGHGAGVFVGLPTMATADALYARAAGLYRRLFAADAAPSLVLAHGRRALHAGFRASVVDLPGEAAAPHARYGEGDTETAGAACARWLADDRRRAFLADIGVGTIDQALLAVLPSRYQSLRLAGLARRILVVDEVHAYDAYMQGELFALLRFQAALGGSAVLLSATLPAGIRDRLTAAFADGAARFHGAPLPAPAAARSTPTASAAPADYPLVTHVHSDGAERRPIEPLGRLARRVRVRRHDTVAAVLDSIVAHAEAGRAVAWIRNAVDDAREGYAALSARLGDRVTLFHARFTVADRAAVEATLAPRFGRDSRPEDRAGRVLVATQVAEQSLDLDFDAMVTDLAPIDLLIQRAGRLHRHARAGRGEPVLELHAPEPTPTADAAWFRRFLPLAASVYPDHGRLWLAASLLLEASGFDVPGDLRRLVEAVYGDDADSLVPPDLQPLMLRIEGDRLADSSLGRGAALGLEGGYAIEGGAWDDDSVVATRLGEPQTLLRLATWDGTTLAPWAADTDAWTAWRRSEVQVRQALVSEEAPEPPEIEAARRAARAPWPDRDDRIRLVPLVRAAEPSWWRGGGLDPRGRAVALRYHPAFGLTVERID